MVELNEALASDPKRPGEQPRVMVFVEYRRLSYMIRDWISSLGPQYKVERYVSRLVSSGDFGKLESLQF